MTRVQLAGVGTGPEFGQNDSVIFIPVVPDPDLSFTKTDQGGHDGN
jgi:hypothetical protein